MTETQLCPETIKTAIALIEKHNNQDSPSDFDRGVTCGKNAAIYLLNELLRTDDND